MFVDLTIFQQHLQLNNVNNSVAYRQIKFKIMSKAKSKTAKKAAPLSGLVVKNTGANNNAKAGSTFLPKANFSSTKKGGITSIPRKAK